MAPDTASWIQSAWQRAKENDLPNWAAVAFTAVLWPVALLLWHRRKVNGVPGLEVHFAPGQISIAGNPYSAIDIQFTNHTGSVVYVSGARVRRCTKAYPVPSAAARDIAGNSYHLKFMDDQGQFVRREVTLQTNTSAKTCMPAPTSLPPEFFIYSPYRLGRLIGFRRYFVLEYTAMVGTAKHLVATRY